jgi:hypothetical protein
MDNNTQALLLKISDKFNLNTHEGIISFAKVCLEINNYVKNNPLSTKIFECNSLEEVHLFITYNNANYVSYS